MMRNSCLDWLQTVWILSMKFMLLYGLFFPRFDFFLFLQYLTILQKTVNGAKRQMIFGRRVLIGKNDGKEAIVEWIWVLKLKKRVCSFLLFLFFLHFLIHLKLFVEQTLIISILWIFIYWVNSPILFINHFLFYLRKLPYFVVFSIDPSIFEVFFQILLEMFDRFQCSLILILLQDDSFIFLIDNFNCLLYISLKEEVEGSDGELEVMNFCYSEVDKIFIVRGLDLLSIDWYFIIHEC